MAIFTNALYAPRAWTLPRRGRRNARLRGQRWHLRTLPLWGALLAALIGALAGTPAAVSAQSGSLTRGIDCGCSKTGNYASPRNGKMEAIALEDAVEAKVISTSATEGRSPNGKYRLVTSGNASSGYSMSVRENKSGGATLLTKHFTGNVDWGFSPDGDGFAYWEVHGNQLTVQVYDLSVRPVRQYTYHTSMYLDASQSGAYVLFSPTGSHLLVVTKEDAVSTRATLLTAADGNVLSRTNSRSAHWGFSPEENRFAYWFLEGNLLTVAFYDLDDAPARLVKTHRESVYTDAAGGDIHLGFGPNGDYLLVTARQDQVSNTVRVLALDGSMPVSETFTGTAGWGFSPDGHRFALWYLTTGGSGETVKLFNLRRRPALVSTETAGIQGGSSRVLFSPGGEYLLHATLTRPTSLQVSVIDTTGTPRHEETVDFYSAPGNVGDKLGNVVWHFSPDAQSRSFVYSWTSGPTTVQWRVANLERGEAVRTETISPVAAFWQFSPCGDVVALVDQGTQATSAHLYRTADGAQVGTNTFNNNNIAFRSTATVHQAVVNGSAHTLGTNTAAQSCQAPGPLALARVSVSPDAVTGGLPATGTVTLNQDAPTGGVEVLLESSSEKAVVPASVKVLAGRATATFEVATVAVSALHEAVITATLDGVAKKDTLGIRPPALVGFALDEDEVVGGNDVGGVVTLDGVAPEGGTVVALGSGDPAVLQVPAAIRVYEDDFEANAPGATFGVDAETTVVMTATLGGVTLKDSVRVKPAGLTELEMDLAVCGTGGGAVIGGRPVTFRVELDGLPPASGAVVALSSSSAAATVPATVTLAPASRDTTFDVATARVQAPTEVVITASYRGVSLTYEMTLIPAPYEFAVTDLGLLPGGSYSRGIAVNNAGEVVVQADGSGGSGPYRWRNGTLTPLPVPPGQLADARAINDAGQIVGSVWVGGQTLPALWAGDSLRTLEVVSGRNGTAYAVNELGQVVGGAEDASGRIRPSRWDDGVLTHLPTPPGYPIGYAFGVNNAGQIVGVASPYLPQTNVATYHGYLYDPEADASRAYGAYNLNSFAYDINDAGQVAGYFGGGVIWQGTSLRWVGGEIKRINAAGNTVGNTCLDCETRGISFATFADAQNQYNLNCLLPEDGGWDLRMANDLNDLNQIVGYGHVGGETHGFLLTPASMAQTTDLSVRIEDAPRNVAAGDTMALVVAVANQGVGPAPNASVGALFAAGLTPLSVASDRGACVIDGQDVRCTLGDVEPAAAFTIRIEAVAAAQGTTRATVLAASESTDGNAANNAALLPVTVHPAPASRTDADVAAGQTDPLGPSDTGLRLVFTDASDTPGALAVRRYDTAPANNDRLLAITVQAPGGPVTPDVVSDARFWTVEAPGLTAYEYTICLSLAALPGMTDPDRMVVVKREQSEEDWRPLPTTRETFDGAAYACAAGLTSFSQFGLASDHGSNPLPVELTSFEAVADGKDAVLRWTTASERNNVGFEVQLQVSPADAPEPVWEVVSFVEGHGTTTAARKYEQRVTSLAAGRHVFRLRQIDFDGAFEYSPEVEVSVALPDRYELGAPHPNPFNPQTQFSLTLAQTEHVTVAVYDLLGRRVALLHDGLIPANQAQRFQFDASALASGVYFIRAAGESFQAVRNITLTK